MATSTTSEDTAMAQESSLSGEEEVQSSRTSVASHEEESKHSESSESSDESEDSEDSASVASEHDDEDDVTILPATKKPRIGGAGLGGAGDLASRLGAFLPQLKKANEELGEGETLEDVEDGEGYIEMNLGLGVLEERKDGEESSASEDEEEEQDDEVLGKLLGRGEKKAVGVEEVT